MLFAKWDRTRDAGLLILRIGLGGMFLYHGFPKIMGGHAFWHHLGMTMGLMGIHFAPTFWGFMAALAEFGGGAMLLIGFLMRPACCLLLIDMIVAVNMHLHMGQGMAIASHAIEDGIVFLSLLFIGPGRFSLDHWIGNRKT